MPSYAKRQTKNGTVFDVRFRIINDIGVEVQKRLCGYPNKRAAQQAYMDFMKDYIPPVCKISKDTKYSYDELINIYKKKMETELAPSSYCDLLSILDKFITPYFQGKTIPSLTKADYTTWQTELWSMKNPKNSEWYAQRYLIKIRSTLMSFLTYCEDTYDIPNLYKQVRRPKRKEMKKEMQFWELDEFLHFSECIDDLMWKTFFMSLFYSGCRIGELLALSDSDVYLSNDNYCFDIHKNITRKTAKRETSFLIVAPKTQTSNRTIILPDVMTAPICDYLNYKKEKGLSGDFFFGGDTPIAEMTYQRRFKYYTEQANLKPIRIHDLRHSHASLLIHLNVPITVISKRLGHSTVKMTLERYSHCYSDGENVAVSALNTALNHGTNDGTNLDKIEKNHVKV